MQPKYKVAAKPVDGNSLSVIGAVTKALRNAGASSEEISQYQEEATNGDYNHLLQVSMKWVDLKPIGEE